MVVMHGILLHETHKNKHNDIINHKIEMEHRAQLNMLDEHMLCLVDGG